MEKGEMRWFKLMTDFDDDEKIVTLTERDGPVAQARLLKIYRIIAKQMDNSDRCFVSYRPGYWTRQLWFRSAGDCGSFLDRLATDRLLIVDRSVTEWSVRCDKLLEIRARKQPIERFASISISTSSLNTEVVTKKDSVKKKEEESLFTKNEEITREEGPNGVDKVFLAYCESWGRNPNSYKLTPKRKLWIKKAIDAYGLEGALLGVQNFRQDEYEDRARFNDIEYLFGGTEDKRQKRVDKYCQPRLLQNTRAFQQGLIANKHGNERLEIALKLAEELERGKNNRSS